MAATRKVAREYRDSDGYWIELIAGWKQDDGAHGIVEDTKRLAYSKLSRIKRCDCAECLSLLLAEGGTR